MKCARAVYALRTQQPGPAADMARLVPSSTRCRVICRTVPVHSSQIISLRSLGIDCLACHGVVLLWSSWWSFSTCLTWVAVSILRQTTGNRPDGVDEMIVMVVNFKRGSIWLAVELANGYSSRWGSGDKHGGKT